MIETSERITFATGTAIRHVLGTQFEATNSAAVDTAVELARDIGKQHAFHLFSVDAQRVRDESEGMENIIEAHDDFMDELCSTFDTSCRMCEDLTKTIDEYNFCDELGNDMASTAAKAIFSGSKAELGNMREFFAGVVQQIQALVETTEEMANKTEDLAQHQQFYEKKEAIAAKIEENKEGGDREVEELEKAKAMYHAEAKKCLENSKKHLENVEALEKAITAKKQQRKEETEKLKEERRVIDQQQAVLRPPLVITFFESPFLQELDTFPDIVNFLQENSYTTVDKLRSLLVDLQQTATRLPVCNNGIE